MRLSNIHVAYQCGQNGSPIMKILHFVAISLHIVCCIGLQTKLIFQWETSELTSSVDRQDRTLYEDEAEDEIRVTGIAFWKERVFLSAPRKYPDTRPTLLTGRNDSLSPELHKFPADEKVGSCKSLNNVRSMELDQFDRLWIIDAGGRTKSHRHCDAKLVIIDLNTNETVRKHEFSSKVVRKDGILDQITVGCVEETDCWAFVTEPLGGKIVVYSLKMHKAWYFKNPIFRVNPTDHLWSNPLASVALSPLGTSFSHLHFSPGATKKLYRMNTFRLRSYLLPNKYGIPLNASLINEVGSFISRPTGGLVMDGNATLYYGLDNGIALWDSYQGYLTNDNQRINTDEDFGRPHALTVDSNEVVALTTVSSDDSEANVKVFRIATK